jgi:CheY-like chemotaxis protein
MKDEDLNAVVTDIEGMLRRLIGEDILLTLKFDQAAGLVHIDPDQMKQVILNLVINACDAMPRGGKLTIETSNVLFEQMACTMLAVSDTGVGMDSDLQARIFEPLFTTKSPDKGTGLGLSTVKRIVTQCRGRIEVDSELGRGSTFKVYLPHVAQSRVRTATLANPTVAWPRGKETVLVVEDDDRVRSLARQVLEICGYTVLEAGDGVEAMRRYEPQAQGIDLLLLDVVMPHMGGRALADRMLELKPLMKVLFVSGYPNETVMRQGVSELEAAFLQKPFTTGSLTQKVRQVLDGRN